MRNRKFIIIVYCFMIALLSPRLSASTGIDLPRQVEVASPSIVGIAVHVPLQSKKGNLSGTGFAIGDGSLIVTNYHVIQQDIDPNLVSHILVLAGKGKNVREYKAEIVEQDPLNDLAILKIPVKLPALSLQSADLLSSPGTSVHIIGFPLGATLGLYPAVHSGVVANVSPNVIPAQNSRQLTKQMMRSLKDPMMIYQLDLTAYPGNSGSPLFDSKSNKVIGVINKVFVTDTKESAITNPSGISYAIPVEKVHALLTR